MWGSFGGSQQQPAQVQAQTAGGEGNTVSQFMAARAETNRTTAFAVCQNGKCEDVPLVVAANSCSIGVRKNMLILANDVGQKISAGDALQLSVTAQKNGESTSLINVTVASVTKRVRPFSTPQGAQFVLPDLRSEVVVGGETNYSAVTYHVTVNEAETLQRHAGDFITKIQVNR